MSTAPPICATASTTRPTQVSTVSTALTAASNTPEVTDKVVERILSGNYDAVILNFANCDLVGHTGVFEAAVKAVETVDLSLIHISLAG